MRRLRVGVAIGVLIGVCGVASVRLAAQLISGVTGNATPNQIASAAMATLANFPLAVTLTARNVSGALLFEKSSRWTVVSSPAVSVQASASIAAEAAVRHVADCVIFSAVSTTAPVATGLTINLRDGATGAGTVIGSWQVVALAATGQNVAPFGVCGLNLPGTTNTAMTLEYSALLTNLFESVTVTGFNVQ